MSNHKFPYRWTLADATFTKDKGKVFSCFACGGGSTMGYKLAGFDVIGCNEIDPRMNKVYVANHHPRFNYLEPIQQFKLRKDLPEELYNLDILDGSPPCSSFSIAGAREEGWGKKKHFREGQAEQVLDTLFFDFIDLAKELQPKIVVAENVKGMLMTEAKKYCTKIFEEFDKAGYYTTLTLCNGTEMGVPQKRERVFFVCVRKDLLQYVPTEGLFAEPSIDLSFNESPILWGDIMIPGDNDNISRLDPAKVPLWEIRKEGDLDLSYCCARDGKNANKYFNSKFLYKDKVANTIAAKDICILFDEPRFRSAKEVMLCSSWPLDYDFLDQRADYICGMSVPPVMMAQVASRVYEQWLSKINNE